MQYIGALNKKKVLMLDIRALSNFSPMCINWQRESIHFLSCFPTREFCLSLPLLNCLVGGEYIFAYVGFPHKVIP